MAGILVCGAVLRVSFPERMSVEHFDEGVYASNVWFGKELGYQYPLRHLYAPPLLPSLIESSILLDQFVFHGAGGPSHLAVMAPNLLAGCLTVLLVWWVARQWFGAAAGVAAATFASLSDFHALYTRTALTDVLLVFWLLLALWLLERAYFTGRSLYAVLAGAVTGLAWWTKYNGWLPLAVGLVALAALLVLDKSQRRHGGRLVTCWLTVAVVALVVWTPFWYSLQSSGGYAAVAANHRQYVVGPAGWCDGFLRQAANLRHFDGWVTCVGMGMALASSGVWTARRGRRGKPQGEQNSGFTWIDVATVAVLAGAVSLVAGATFVLAVLALTGVVVALRKADRPVDGAGPDTTHSAGWLLAAWWFGLLFATPLYHPYPRLALPWLCASWIGGGLAVAWLLRRLQDGSQRASRQWKLPGLRSLLLLGTAVGLAAGAWSAPKLTQKSIPAWQPRTGLEQVARRIVDQTRSVLAADREQADQAFVVYVYGEPGLFFHLRAQGIEYVGPVQDLSFANLRATNPSIPVFLVTGPHAHRSEQFTQQWRRASSRFRELARYAYWPSDLVLLDQVSPGDLPPAPERGPEEVRVFLLSTSETPPPE